MISGPFHPMARRVLLGGGITGLLCAASPAQQQSPPSGNQPPATQSHMRFQTPLFLSGEIVLEDGNPPPEDVRVELVCHGSVVRQEYASPTGDFSFQLGSGASPLQLSSAPMDASVSGDPTRGVTAGAYASGQMDPFGGSNPNLNSLRAQVVDLSGCELKALTPGYRSSAISLGRRRPLDNPNVGTLVLSRLGNVRGTTISAASLAAPARARRAYDKAQKELRKKKPDYKKAGRELEKALKAYPEYAAAWNRLGDLKLLAKDEAGARDAFEKAIAADPDYVRPYLSLANLHFMSQDWRAVRKLTTQILELNPHIPRAHFFQAVSCFFLGDVETAEESLRIVHASSEANRYPLSHYLKGAILAQQGQVILAASQLRLFLKLSPEGRVADKVRRQLEIWETQGLISDAAPQSDQ